MRRRRHGQDRRRRCLRVRIEAERHRRGLVRITVADLQCARRGADRTVDLLASRTEPEVQDPPHVRSDEHDAVSVHGGLRVPSARGVRRLVLDQRPALTHADRSRRQTGSEHADHLTPPEVGLGGHDDDGSGRYRCVRIEGDRHLRDLEASSALDEEEAGRAAVDAINQNTESVTTHTPFDRHREVDSARVVSGARAVEVRVSTVDAGGRRGAVLRVHGFAGPVARCVHRDLRTVRQVRVRGNGDNRYRRRWRRGIERDRNAGTERCGIVVGETPRHH